MTLSPPTSRRCRASPSSIRVLTNANSTRHAHEQERRPEAPCISPKDRLQRLERPDALEEQRRASDEPADGEPDPRQRCRGRGEDDADAHDRAQSSTPADRRAAKRSERPSAGVVPSHASLTPLKHAVNATRNVASSRSADSTGVEDHRRVEVVAGGRRVLEDCCRARAGRQSIDASSSTKRIDERGRSEHDGPGSGFQCRMTTLMPASRISPTLSGRSVDVATAAKVPGIERLCAAAGHGRQDHERVGLARRRCQAR